MRELLKKEKIVAVGEIGLDYYWDKEGHDLQKHWFIRQLDLAREMNKPVMIHSREAAADTMEIMKEHGKGLKGVIHCYSYSLEMAREYVKMGYYIGVGGVVTFKNSKKLKEIVEEIPLESIVLETDCPYLAPTPVQREEKFILVPAICCRSDCRAKRHFCGAGDRTDREECKGFISIIRNGEMR